MNNLKIRRLTPKECFRLMGVRDEDFNKLKNQTDNSLYHLAGDSIVVNVLMAIFKELLWVRFINQNLHHTKLELSKQRTNNEVLERERERVSKGQVNFTKDNEYYTPKKIVKYFGEFDYDPATTKEKAEEFGVEHYDTIETDGLKTDWSQYKKIWINPPFSEKHKFVEKAYETYKKAPYIYIYTISNRIFNYKKIS